MLSRWDLSTICRVTSESFMASWLYRFDSCCLGLLARLLGAWGTWHDQRFSHVLVNLPWPLLAFYIWTNLQITNNLAAGVEPEVSTRRESILLSLTAGFIYLSGLYASYERQLSSASPVFHQTFSVSKWVGYCQRCLGSSLVILIFKWLYSNEMSLGIIT